MTEIVYVYFAHDGSPTERVKIGLSTDPRKRMKAIKCELLFAVACGDVSATRLERALHAEFGASQVLNHDRPNGYSEWFFVTPRLQKLIAHVRLTQTWPFDGTRVLL